MAWTTTVAAPSAAMMRLRAMKHQRWPSAPGGSSEITAPRSATAACSRQPRAGYGDVRARREHGDGAPGRLERAGVRGRVDARARARRRRARAPRRGRGRARGRPRARTTTPGARRPRRPRPRRAARPGAEHVQHRGRVGEIAQPLRIASRQRHTVVSPAAAARARAAGGVERRVARAATSARRGRAAPRRGSASTRPGARPLLELDLRAGRRRRDQVGPPQAVVARASTAGLRAAVRACRRSAGSPRCRCARSRRRRSRRGRRPCGRRAGCGCGRGPRACGGRRARRAGAARSA